MDKSNNGVLPLMVQFKMKLPSKTDVEGDLSGLSPETLDETNIQLYFGFSLPGLGVSVALVL